MGRGAAGVAGVTLLLLACGGSPASRPPLLPEPLPAEAALHLSSPHLGDALTQLGDLARRFRPVPDFRALAQLAIGQLEPQADLDAPCELYVRRQGPGDWGWVLLLTVRPGGAPPAEGGWRVRRVRNHTLHSTHLRPDLLALTDAPAWVTAQRDSLVQHYGRGPAADLTLRVSPEAVLPAGKAGTAPGAGDLGRQTQLAELSLDFSPEALELGFRVLPRPGTPLAAALATPPRLPVALLASLPAGAPVVMAGDVSALALPAARSLATNLDWMDALEGEGELDPPGASMPQPLPGMPMGGGPWPGAGEPGGRQAGGVSIADSDPSARRLRALWPLVTGEFLWSLQGTPGSGTPTLFLAARMEPQQTLAAIWESLGDGRPLPVAYRLGTLEVHRIEGEGHFLPADLALREGVLYVGAGGTPRVILDDVLSGRLAAGLETHPALQTLIERHGKQALLLGTVEVMTLLRLFGEPGEGITGGQEPGGRPITPPAEYVVTTDGQLLSGLWRVPMGLVDQLAPLLRQRLGGPGDVVPDSTDWLFPQGI